ncbi:MAG TPA: CoA transferase, partial [Dehalococcoidia bacterium]|nr:CoA transferase [Dehalococcoidia bacterium]
MLSPYRVLDLTDSRAALGPQILADLGAEVILIEPPGGSAERNAGTAFAAYNRNKRSVTLDFDATAGRDRFFDLVRGADFLFENAAPGAMAARGMDFAALRSLNPRLIYVAISPFGQDGPYRDFAAADLTIAALSGQMAIYGDADRPPVRMSVPQAWRHAAAESAVGALVALQRRLQTGEAQFVDVSAQAALVLTAVNATIAAAVQGKDFERNGSKVQLGLYTAPTIFACADGYAVLFSQNLWPKLVRWMVEDGSVPASWLTDVQWATFFPDFLSGKPVKHSYDELVERAAAFVAKHPVQALFRRGLAEQVFIAPVNTLADVLAFDHLQARGYWQPLRLPDGAELRAPGPFVRAGATPIRYRRGVPEPGEANEALAPLAPAAQDTGGSAQADAALLAGAGDTLPFAGLRVADFSWVGVGPLTAKYLADHGATTVRVETSQPPDILRVNGPFAGGEFGVNRSHFFGMFNTSKQSIALNLKHPTGKEVAKRLIGWADVYLESFTPGTMADLGL